MLDSLDLGAQECEQDLPSRARARVAGLPRAAQGLLDAVAVLSSDLDLDGVLTRLVTAACELSDARHGALGIIGSTGGYVDFRPTGADPRVRDRADAAAEASGVLVVPVLIRGTVFGRLSLWDRAGGGSFTTQDELLVEKLATAAGFVIENARAYGLNERRRQWLEATTALADALHPPVELDRALREVTETVRSVSGARAAGVLLAGETRPTVSADPGDVELVTGVLHRVAALEPQGRDLVRLTVGSLCCLVVPLHSHDASKGALVAVFDAEREPLDAEDRELLVTMADQASLALDRAGAALDREQLVIVTERERIARDLHDVVIQRLFASGLLLQTLAMRSADAEVAERLDKVVGDLDLTNRDIRATIFDLRRAGGRA